MKILKPALWIGVPEECLTQPILRVQGKDSLLRKQRHRKNINVEFLIVRSIRDSVLKSNFIKSKGSILVKI